MTGILVSRHAGAIPIINFFGLCWNWIFFFFFSSVVFFPIPPWVHHPILFFSFSPSRSLGGVQRRVGRANERGEREKIGKRKRKGEEEEEVGKVLPALPCSRRFSTLLFDATLSVCVLRQRVLYSLLQRVLCAVSLESLSAFWHFFVQILIEIHRRKLFLTFT